MDLKGQFLVAMPTMGDDLFEETVVYVLEHNSQSSLGIVINRPLDFRFNELVERLGFGASVGEPSQFESRLFWGGPVTPEQGFILHDRGKFGSTMVIDKNVRCSITLEALKKIVEGKSPMSFFTALGYSSWGNGQIEQEIEEDKWFVAPFRKDILFDLAPEQRYDEVLSSLGVNPALFKSLDGVGHA